MTPARVVTIFGGSSPFFPALAESLARHAAGLPSLVVRLYGRDEGRLGVVGGFCSRMAQHRDTPHRYEWTTDLDRACEGLDLAVNLIRAGGLEGRHFDETAPLKWGIPGDETLGPGGLGSAVRGVRLAIDIGGAVRRHSPDARFMNLANPLGILVAALTDVLGPGVFGLCELPETTLIRVAELCGVSRSRIDFEYLGINHQGFFTKLAEGDRDLFPILLESLLASGDPWQLGFDPSLLTRLRMLPLSYLRLHFHPEREVAHAKKRARSRARELSALSDVILKDLARGSGEELPASLSGRAMPWHDLAVVPTIAACLGGAPTRQFVTKSWERGLGGLGAGAVLEVPAMVDEGALTPTFDRIPRSLPSEAREYLDAALRFEILARRAAEAPDLRSLEMALDACPMVGTAGSAKEIAREILAHCQPIRTPPGAHRHANTL